MIEQHSYLDLRIIKTRSKIKKAFIELLKNKKLKEITINEVIAKATISRGAFYRNFKDKEDLVNQFRTAALKDLIAIFEKLQKADKDVFFIQLFNYLQGEGEILRLLLSNQGSTKTVEELKLYIQSYANKYIVPFVKTDAESEIEKHYLIIYYSNASLGVIQEWINSGQKETP